MVNLARAFPEEKLNEVDIYCCMLLIWAGRVLIKELKRLSTLVGDLLGERRRYLFMPCLKLISKYDSQYSMCIGRV
jgi:hypothetical protein